MPRQYPLNMATVPPAPSCTCLTLSSLITILAYSLIPLFPLPIWQPSLGLPDGSSLIFSLYTQCIPSTPSTSGSNPWILDFVFWPRHHLKLKTGHCSPVQQDTRRVQGWVIPILCPSETCVEVLIPGSWYPNRAFADVIKLRWSHNQSGLR